VPAPRRTTDRPPTRRVAGARRQAAPATAGAPSDSLAAGTPVPLAAPEAGAAGPAPATELAAPDTRPAADPQGSAGARDDLTADDLTTADPAAADPATDDPATGKAAADDPAEPTPPESTKQTVVRRPGPGPLPRPRTTRAAKSAATDTADPDTARKGRKSGAGSTRLRRLWFATAALVAAAFAMGILATSWLGSYRDAQARELAWQRALPAAKENVARLFSYDYRHIQADRTTVAALLTGQFRTDYLSSMDKLVIPQAPAKRFVLVSTTQSAGVSSVTEDGHQAVVIVFLNQAISNTDVKARTDLVRLRVTMTLVGDRWLISEVKSV
jgi:hypothetical protein